MAKIDELQERQLRLNQEAHDLTAKAEAEKRDLTEQELLGLSANLDEVEKIGREIANHERLAQQTDRLHERAGRRTEPEPPGRRQPVSDDDGDGQALEAARRERLLNGNPSLAPARPREPAGGWAQPLRGDGGFRSLGEMAYHCRLAAGPSRVIDARLARLATPTVYGSEGTGADGGFAVPPDFRNAIMAKVMGEDSLMSRTDQLTSSSNTITLPKDETTPWQTSGGIQAYWEGEGQLKTQSKPALDTNTLRLNKIIALVPMTDELLEDAPAMDAYLRRKAPEKINFKVNLAVIQGTGVGQPLGILTSGSKVSVAKDAGQATGTITYTNIVNMWARMYAGSRRNAVWLVNQDAEAALGLMQFVTGAASPVPVYLPVGGVSGSPFASLYNRPVIPSEAMNALGLQGDIMLVDLSQYLTVTKTAGSAVRTDVSMHLWFDYDMTAYRFVLRVGGAPWWSAPVTPRAGSNTRSYAVVLDDRP